jgi:hypothetical protein
MKQLKVLTTICAMTAGCAGGDYGDDDREIPAEVELAKIQQPLYMWEGYGSLNSQNRCTWPLGGGEQCHIPSRKTWKFTSKCHLTGGLPNSQGCNAQVIPGYTMANVISVATQDMAQWVSAIPGWSLTYVSPQQTPDGWVDPVGNLPGNTGGQAWCDQINTGGAVFKCKHPVVDVDLGNIQSINGYAQLNNGQKLNFVINIIHHEIGHAMGLGHVPSSTGTLMSVSPTMTSWFTGIMYPTNYERCLMEGYSPNGSTPAFPWGC